MFQPRCRQLDLLPTSELLSMRVPALKVLLHESSPTSSPTRKFSDTEVPQLWSSPTRKFLNMGVQHGNFLTQILQQGSFPRQINLNLFGTEVIRHGSFPTRKFSHTKVEEVLRHGSILNRTLTTCSKWRMSGNVNSVSKIILLINISDSFYQFKKRGSCVTTHRLDCLQKRQIRRIPRQRRENCYWHPKR